MTLGNQQLFEMNVPWRLTGIEQATQMALEFEGERDESCFVASVSSTAGRKLFRGLRVLNIIFRFSQHPVHVAYFTSLTLAERWHACTRHIVIEVAWCASVPGKQKVLR